MRPTLNTIFLALIGLCFVFALAVVALDAGVQATPWETADSQGRTMQFNDRFSAEHYRIVLGHIRPWQILHPRYFYEWILLAMMAVGAWRLRSDEISGTRATRWFFFGQSVLFIIGWLSLGFLQWPRMVVDLLRCTLDREDFVDMPFTWMMAQPPWVLVSFVIGAALPARSLGIREASRHLARQLAWRV